MKKIIFFILIPLSCFAQNSFLFEYDVSLNSLERKGYLHFNENSNPYYFETSKNNNLKDTKSDKDGSYEFKIILGDNSSKKRFQVYEKDTLFNIDFLNKKKVVCFEKFSKMSWEIKNETKIISNYNCIKAEIMFRGRKYIAWFTTKIPIRLGPWKFTNTPGLIMQIYDETQKFTWSITKIKFTKDFEEFEVEKKLEKISLKEFVQLKEKSNLEMVNQSMLKFKNRGLELAESQYIRGRETKFEWEEEKKKQ